MRAFSVRKEEDGVYTNVSSPVGFHDTRGPHSVQEVPDRVLPGRQFAIISRKPFALPAKQTPYTCPMRRALIINAFIPPSHFCQNRPKTTSHEILQKSDGIIEIEH
ncbi:hypothetical protein OUZ56_020211 [Daphnia magna]|uniref:Uncharacterized protein n=1 Tax=Daphnia magna TaxID=35525 RepID=A0ABQ9ZDV7_9CRUS|nr:hypothetical protein OUZ56_020211 [Daphnia magna]